MNHKIKSLNDLTIALHEINKKYKVSDFIEEYKKVVENTSGSILDELRIDSSINPFQKITNISSNITDEMMEKLLSSTEELTNKYDYIVYLEECNSLRETFLKDRKNYFSSKVVFNTNKKDEMQNIFELSGAYDVILADFIDKSIAKIEPNHLDIIYEDLNGKKITTKIRHKSPSITKEHVEAPLIDRYHGINAYDSFLLRSYYDIKKNDWIYIPIRLIVKLNCEENLLGMIETIT